MQDPRLKRKVGAFVFVGVLLLGLSIFMFGGNRFLWTSTFNLRLELKDVQGLAPGSVVSLAGLPIGNVKSIELGDQNKLVVTLRVAANEAQRIGKSSVASLRTQGALGDKFIYIEPAQPGEMPIQDNAYIASAPHGGLFEVLSERGNEAEKVFDILRELQLFTSGLNRGGQSEDLMRSLITSSRSLERAMIDLKASGQELKEVLKQDGELRLALGSLKSILKKIDQGEGTLGKLVNDSSLHRRLTQVLGEEEKPSKLRPMLRESIKEAKKERAPSAK